MSEATKTLDTRSARTERRASASVLGLALLIASAQLAACSSSDDAAVASPGPSADGGSDAPALAIDPDGLGPYAIGVTTIETPAGDGGGRVLPIEVWYPATVAAGAPAAQYSLTAGALKLATLDSPNRAVRDAPADRSRGPYPVVVFSHGNGGVRFQSVYLTEVLASHGFIVAAPDHVGNTFRELIATSAALTLAEAARVRPADVSATLDALLARSADGADPLHDLADPARVGVAGHSFGGYTAARIAGATLDAAAVAAACAAAPGASRCDGWDALRGPFPASARDARFLAALPQAPGIAKWFAPSGYAAIAVPTMVQGGSVDLTMPFAAESAPVYDAIATAPAYLLEVEKAGHFTYSDFCALIAIAPDLAGLVGDAFGDGCGPTNLPADRAHALVDRFAVAFLQVYVAQNAAYAPFLAAPSPLPADVTRYEAKGAP